MGFRFRRSFKIAPGVRINFNSKSTSVRIGPKGLGYTVSSNGKKRVTASIPGTGISYSEVVPSDRRRAVPMSRAVSDHTRSRKPNLWPVIVVVFGLVIAFNVFGSKTPATNQNVAAGPPAAISIPTPSPVVVPSSGRTTLPATPSTAPAPAPAAIPEVRFVTASSLNVRSAPSTSGNILSSASNGQQLTVLGRESGWLRIQTDTGSEGWVSEQFTSASRPAPVATPRPQALLSPPAQTVNRDAIIQKIIERSIRNYSGNCPCPYNTMRNGRSCGGNSAYSKPGGRSPICYPGDVTEAMIAAFRP